MTDDGDPIAKGIDFERVIEFSYATQEPIAVTYRTVSPWAMDEDNFIGWDHGRDEIRRFRYDRTGEVTIVPLGEDGLEYVRPTQ